MELPAGKVLLGTQAARGVPGHSQAVPFCGGRGSWCGRGKGTGSSSQDLRGLAEHREEAGGGQAGLEALRGAERVCSTRQSSLSQHPGAQG